MALPLHYHLKPSIRLVVKGSAMVRHAPTSMRLDPIIKEALARAAADDDRSVSTLVERILKAWLVEKGYLGKGVTPKADGKSD